MSAKSQIRQSQSLIQKFNFQGHLNNALQKAQNVASVPRAKEEVQIILSKIATKEDFKLFITEIARSIHTTPLLERKFAIFSLQKTAERLGQDVKSFLPQIMKYVCQRMTDMEIQSDSVYSTCISKLVNVLTQQIYAQPAQLLDIYDIPSSSHKIQRSFSTSFVEQPQVYSPNVALNCILSPLLSLLQRANPQTQAAAAESLSECLFVAPKSDLETYIPLISECILTEAEKLHDGVRRLLQMFLLQNLTVIYSKFGQQIQVQIQTNRIVQLILKSVKSQEYGIRLNCILLAEQLVLQKLLDYEQTTKFNVLASDLKSDKIITVRQAAQKLFLMTQQEELPKPEKPQKIKFSEFKKKLQLENELRGLKKFAQGEVLIKLKEKAESDNKPNTIEDIEEIELNQSTQDIQKDTPIIPNDSQDQLSNSEQINQTDQVQIQQSQNQNEQGVENNKPPFEPKPENDIFTQKLKENIETIKENSDEPKIFQNTEILQNEGEQFYIDDGTSEESNNETVQYIPPPVPLQNNNRMRKQSSFVNPNETEFCSYQSYSTIKIKGINQKAAINQNEMIKSLQADRPTSSRDYLLKKTKGRPMSSKQIFMTQQNNHNNILSEINKLKHEYKSAKQYKIQLVKLFNQEDVTIESMQYDEIRELIQYIGIMLNDGFIDQMLPWIEEIINKTDLLEEETKNIILALEKIWPGHPRWAQIEQIKGTIKKRWL
ncbi:Conserved_hypothetical protein [Hexamita inflata]|uniref:Uncharacterized protein n=1 Tax=Hexamita inflata TaxID=28002 RepID=A0AA86RHE1_9EUKA|nr:Conserved hypothetical protein [Hexamita inflata]